MSNFEPYKHPTSSKWSKMTNFLTSLSEDYGLNETETALAFCICCLEREGPLINLLTCSHADFLNSFMLPEIKPKKQVICLQCHDMLKKIKLFKLQVEDSFKLLSEQGNISKCSNQKNNLKVYKVLKLTLPETEKINIENQITILEPANINNIIKNKEFIDDTEKSILPKSSHKKNIVDIEKSIQPIFSHKKSIDDTEKSIQLKSSHKKSMEDTEKSIQLKSSHKKFIDDTEKSIHPKSSHKESIGDIEKSIQLKSSHKKSIDDTEKTIQPKSSYKKIIVNIEKCIQPKITHKKSIDDTEKSIQLKSSYKKSMEDTEKSILPKSLHKKNIDDIEKCIQPKSLHKKSMDDTEKSILPKSSQKNSFDDIEKSIQLKSSQTTDKNLKNIEEPSKIMKTPSKVGTVNNHPSKCLQNNDKNIVLLQIVNTESNVDTEKSLPINKTQNTDKKRKNIEGALKIISDNKNNGCINLLASLQSLSQASLSDLLNNFITKPTEISDVNVDSSTNSNATAISIDNVANITDDDSLLSENDDSDVVEMELNSPVTVKDVRDDGHCNTRTEDKDDSSFFVNKVTLTREELVLERSKIFASTSYLRSPYRCESCLIGFNYEENLDHHHKTKHTQKEGNLNCDICLQSVAHDVYEKHTFWHYTRFACLFCGQMFFSYDESVSHYKKKHGKPVTCRCHQCGYETRYKHKLSNHFSNHSVCKDVTLGEPPSKSSRLM